ncbi:hypothetical protein [Motilibacter rhizosphaerae]|uniref:hypothetical protein n=1 Tax=Motilibacter rhizosphaerae TaxID=598652 RepID=UPI00102B9E83|nr:hypothetical protein [Motilibacter rhizosphaerae]
MSRLPEASRSSSLLRRLGGLARAVIAGSIVWSVAHLTGITSPLQAVMFALLAGALTRMVELILRGDTRHRNR